MPAHSSQPRVGYDLLEKKVCPPPPRFSKEAWVGQGTRMRLTYFQKRYDWVLKVERDPLPPTGISKPQLTSFFHTAPPTCRSSIPQVQYSISTGGVGRLPHSKPGGPWPRHLLHRDGGDEPPGGQPAPVPGALSCRVGNDPVL